MRGATKLLVGALIVATTDASLKVLHNVTSSAPSRPSNDDHQRVLSEDDKHDDEQRAISVFSVRKKSRPDVETLVEMADWLTKDLSVVRLSEMMKPGMYKNIVPADLKTVMQYVKGYLAANPKNKRSVIATLTKHFKSDYHLSKIIELAHENQETKEVASRLQSLQFERWIGLRISPQQLCKLLKLDKLEPYAWISTDVFGIPTWFKYFDVYARQHPFEQTTLLQYFTLWIGEEGVAKMLIKGSKHGLNSNAQRILTEQTQAWLANGIEQLPIFKLWQLNKVKIEKLFRHKLFLPWVQYTHKTQALNYDKSQTVTILLKYHEYVSLINTIRVALKDPVTKTVAEELLPDLQRYWLRKKTSLAEVFDTLHSERSLDKVLVNPFFLYWYNYGTLIRTMAVSIEANPIKVLERAFGGCDQLQMLCIQATYMKATKVVARFLLTEQIRQSLKMFQEPEMQIPLLGAKVLNVDTVQKDYIAALKKTMTVEEDSVEKVAAESWQRKLLRFWHKVKAPFEVIFGELELETTIVELLGNPLFRLWYRYVVEYPPENDKIMHNPILVLEGICGGYDKLHDMLTMAIQKPEVEVMAKFLLIQQMTLKMKKTENVESISSLPDVELASVVREDYEAVLSEFASLRIDGEKSEI